MIITLKIFLCMGEEVCFFSVGPELSCNIERNFIVNACKELSLKIPSWNLFGYLVFVHRLSWCQKFKYLRCQ